MHLKTFFIMIYVKERLVLFNMSRILKILTSRLFTWIALMLLQILWFVGVFYFFSTNFAWAGRAMEIIAIFIVLTIVNRQENPSYKLAWAVVILALPVLGLALYALLGSSTITKKKHELLYNMHNLTVKELPKDQSVLQEIEKKSKGVAKQSEYIYNVTDLPVYKNEGVTYYSAGEELFEPILEDLRNAKEYIFLEFFIIQRGVFLDSILQILEEKVQEGVEVRFLYDDMGSVSSISRHFDKELQKLGIKCQKFNPLKPIISVVMNNRDHRKIIVVDGKVAYTGGFNLADEYINKVERFGYWKDNGIRLEGPAVSNIVSMFLEMWQYSNAIKEDISPYFVDFSGVEWKKERGYLQPYADSPLDKEEVGETVYLNIINRAKDYIYIFTPYLIIDNEMMTALCNASKSGVDVHIICPGIPDKKVVFMLTQSYYGQLIRAGVHIHEYKKGFMHAKCFVCDDCIATVGTINLDYRSLYMHFECGVWMYHTEAVSEIKEDALKTMAQSREITIEEVNKNWIKRTAQGLLRMFAPLM